MSGLVTDPYAGVELNARSVIMSTVAPYNTLQLTATPRTVSGAPFTGLVETTYLTKDTTLAVTPDGLVTALVKTPGTWVLASMRDVEHNVTRVDTVFVVVTETTPASPLATFAIQRPSGDSAKITIYSSGSPKMFADTIRIAATAENGANLLPSLSVRFSISDSSVAKIDSKKGIVLGQRPGEVMIRATTTYYGVTKTDSLHLTVGNPLVVKVQPTIVPSPTVAGEYIRIYNPNIITIGVGGTVMFSQAVSLTAPPLEMDVVFDDPDAAQPSTLPTGLLTGSGNIEPIPSPIVDGKLNPACVPLTICLGASRSFHVAGTYHYHSALYGTTGTIIVAAP
jgi:hypothetical protein